MKPLYRPAVKTVAGPLNGQHYSIQRGYSPPAAQDRPRRKVAEIPCKQRAFRDPPRTPAGPLPDPFPTNKPATRPAPALPPQGKRSKLWSEPLFRRDRPAGSRRHSLKFRIGGRDSERGQAEKPLRIRPLQSNLGGVETALMKKNPSSEQARRLDNTPKWDLIQVCIITC
jgi:hypothetical protein